MPPRPVTDNSSEVAALVQELAILSSGQPVTSAQVAYMLETNQPLRQVYDAYHQTWSRLDTKLAHSELAVTDALRRLEGYSSAGFSARRFQERGPNGRTQWIFAPRITQGTRLAAESTQTLKPTSASPLTRVVEALNRIATAIETQNAIIKDSHNG